jgi:hypothetical protein
MEYWQQIEGWEDYEVSDHGRVRSRPRLRPQSDGVLTLYPGRLLKAYTNEHGYLRVTLARMLPSGTVQARKFYVQRLVALHFVIEAPKETVNHIDLDKTNNHWSNLEWMTRVENSQHAVALYDMKGARWRERGLVYSQRSQVG